MIKPIAAAAALFAVAGSAAAALPNFDVALASSAGSAPAFQWAAKGSAPAAVGALTPRLLAVARARDFASRSGAALGLTSTAVDAAAVRDVHDTGRGGVIVRLQQQVGGYEVFNRQVNVLMSRDGEHLATSGTFSDAAVGTPRFNLGAAQAISAAYRNIGAAVLPSALSLLATADGYSTFSRPGALGNLAFTREPRAKSVLFPLADRLVAAYYVEVMAAQADGERADYGMVISAENGSVLFRKSLIEEQAYTYRVFADNTGIRQPYDAPLGNGYAPFTGATFQTVAPRVSGVANLVTLTAGPISTNDPWLPAGATTTTGNNVDAYLDSGLFLGLPGTAALADGFRANSGDLRTSLTSANTFDYPIAADQNPAATAPRNAAVVNLFYVNNWLHDYFYDHGFDEAAGNAQQNNYGRGGAANDRILAEGQDASGRNNANMSTPADGGQPRMQMYLFDGINGVDLDGTLDNQIITHEFFHYVSNRLVGNASGLSNQQGRGMGEGWSDFAALLLTVRPEDLNAPGNANYSGPYPLAYYSTPNFSAAYQYFGIRRQPYSRSFAFNSLTFRHIQNGTPLPTTAPVAFGANGANNAEVHNTGEIWSNMLFECYTNLLNSGRYSFTDARDRMTDYLIGGLKMTPNAPTILQARDALLAAAMAGSEADYRDCAAGFAKRGAGIGAVGPGSNSTTNVGVTESYVAP